MEPQTNLVQVSHSNFISMLFTTNFSILPGSTSEDMTSDSEYEVDTELLDSLGNTAVIEGPPGSGKTAAVFALAAEMGFNVLEVNASSNRTGKQVSLCIISFIFSTGCSIMKVPKVRPCYTKDPNLTFQLQFKKSENM